MDIDPARLAKDLEEVGMTVTHTRWVGETVWTPGEGWHDPVNTIEIKTESGNVGRFPEMHTWMGDGPPKRIGVVIANVVKILTEVVADFSEQFFVDEWHAQIHGNVVRATIITNSSNPGPETFFEIDVRIYSERVDGVVAAFCASSVPEFWLVTSRSMISAYGLRQSLNILLESTVPWAMSQAGLQEKDNG